MDSWRANTAAGPSPSTASRLRWGSGIRSSLYRLRRGAPRSSPGGCLPQANGPSTVSKSPMSAGTCSLWPGSTKEVEPRERALPLRLPPALTLAVLQPSSAVESASVAHVLGGYPLLHVGVAAPGVHIGLIHRVPRLPVAGRRSVGVGRVGISIRVWVVRRTRRVRVRRSEDVHANERTPV